MTDVLLDDRKTEQNIELLTKLKLIVNEESISQKELAKKLGYSQAAVNTYLNNKYEGNVKEFETALIKFLDLSKNKKSYKKIRLDFEKTTVAQRFYNVAQICQLNSEIGLCIGVSGLGKTTAIKNYAKTHSGVIVIDPDENISVRDLLRSLGEEIRVKLHNNTSCQDFCQLVVNRLKDSGYLIVVDEAENIDSSCFRTLRKIHDRCEFTFGLLFVGTDRLSSNLSRMRGEYSYVTNRLGYIENLDSLTFEDSIKLVKQIFPNCNDDILKAFYKQCAKNARHLFNLIKRTHDIFMSSNDELNVKMVECAAKKISL